MVKRYSLTGYEKNDDEDLWLWDDIPEKGFELGYKVEELMHYEKSKYQEISIAASTGFGKMLVLDGIPQYTTKDGFIYNEMLVHVPLTIHPNPRKVAIIGGGNCGAAREAIKYDSVEEVDTVEIDKRVVEVSNMWLSKSEIGKEDKRAKLIYQDGTEWIKEQKGAYDVLLLDRSDPYGPSIDLYKEIFYKNIYTGLKDDGLMVCQSGSPYFYLDILKNTVNLLRRIFPIVCVYLATIPSFPGGIWSFTLASKKWDPIVVDLSRLKCENTQYINRKIFISCFHLPNYLIRELDIE
ncbi:MAG: polyamine aminopropyltransferase [Peptococcaceae bacterium]|nr:polyamine aminopropyltransferase [Peptococcaceae bacterium]